MKAEDIITYNACHVSDGELYEGWRVGCDDLVFRRGADEAMLVKEEEVKQKAIEAFRVMGEETRFDITTDVLIKAKEIFMHELNK